MRGECGESEGEGRVGVRDEGGRVRDEGGRVRDVGM